MGVQDFRAGYSLGNDIGGTVGGALAKGVAEWRELQRVKQERREFDGELAVDEQRRLKIVEETTPPTRTAYEEAKTMLRKYPDAQRITRPIPGPARPDGSLEQEEVVVTPEGEIPLGMLQQFDTNEREAFFRRQKAEMDRLMNFQARLPENRFVRQYVAGQFLNLDREQALFLQKIKAQTQDIELTKARIDLERAQAERQRLATEDQRLATADERARKLKTFETDERVRGDLAIAAGKAKIEGPAEPKLSKGSEARDQAFARDVYVPMVANGGFADVEKSIEQLGGIIEELKTTDSATGPAVGNLPEMARTVVAQRSVALQDRVGEVVQKNLRLILGSQFTEKEAANLLKRTYNPALPEAENIQRLEKLRQQVQRAYAQQRAASSYFEQKGTLDGFKGGVGFGAAPSAAPPLGAGGSEAPQQQSAAPPVAPEFAQDAEAIRQAYREKRISKEQALQQLEALENAR